jgi:hypothetical protein
MKSLLLGKIVRVITTPFNSRNISLNFVFNLLLSSLSCIFNWQRRQKLKIKDKYILSQRSLENVLNLNNSQHDCYSQSISTYYLIQSNAKKKFVFDSLLGLNNNLWIESKNFVSIKNRFLYEE